MSFDPTIFTHWEPVIGLEIHVQLNTKSKLFSSAHNRFGDEPNTNISYVDTGQPGTLPVLNKEAVHTKLSSLAVPSKLRWQTIAVLHANPTFIQIAHAIFRSLNLICPL